MADLSPDQIPRRSTPVPVSVSGGTPRHVEANRYWETLPNIQAFLQAAGDLFDFDKGVHYLRPPYGSTDANIRSDAAELGYATVIWGVDPQDW